MESEKPVPMPLTGEEVQNAVLYKVQEAMQNSCHLRLSDAYTSFNAEITVRLTLSDYGRVVHSNHNAVAADDTGLPQEAEPRVSEGNLTVDPMPPNEVRVETDQAVPVKTVQDGKSVIRHLKYAPRKKDKNG
jgi:hypothetical protein